MRSQGDRDDSWGRVDFNQAAEGFEKCTESLRSICKLWGPMIHGGEEAQRRTLMSFWFVQLSGWIVVQVAEIQGRISGLSQMTCLQDQMLVVL